MGNGLGHYTNLYSLEKILQNMKLRFGSFDKTNDPFENRNLEFTVMHPVYDNVGFDSDIFFADGQLKKSFKLLCFSMSDNIDFFHNLPRMWFQYADNHRGCCLIFDKREFDKEFKLLKEEKYKSSVSYNLNQKRVEIKNFRKQLELLPPNKQTDINIITDLMYKVKKLFLYSKMQDWKQEKEYRYCIYTHSNKDIFINIAESLSEIILGENVSYVYKEMLYTWGKEKDISISYIYWENGFPCKIKLDDQKINEARGIASL